MADSIRAMVQQHQVVIMFTSIYNDLRISCNFNTFVNPAKTSVVHLI
jgi:hypothetical protein